MQALYDYTSNAATAHLTGDKSTAAAIPGALTELHVEGFDAEQIWLQLDMASAQLVRRAKRLLKKAGTDPSLLTPETEEDLTGQQAAPLVLTTGSPASASGMPSTRKSGSQPKPMQICSYLCWY